MSQVDNRGSEASLSLVPSLSSSIPDDNAQLRMRLDDAEEHIAQLERALDNRVIIGQAEGLLMERMGLDAEEAIAYLKRASMDLNRKLVDIAAEIMHTRQLPDLT